MANAFDWDNVMRLPHPNESPLPDAVDVEIIADDPHAAEFDPKTGTIRIEGENGGVTIDFPPEDDEDEGADHFANLAGKIPREVLDTIASDLLEGIQRDDDSRSEWLSNYSNGISLLGLQLRYPNTSSASGAQLEGTSKVNHPLLKEAVLRFQANARAELLPTDGPLKVRNDGAGTAISDILAQALEGDLNHYLTVTATEYYPDTDRSYFYTGFSGTSFKKVYPCPIRRRPVSESIDAKDLIVSNAATDLRNCNRITHRIMMPPATLKRMQLVGAYRDVEVALGVVSTTNAADQKIAEIQGIQPQTSSTLPEDRDREIYECDCQIEIKGYEHKEKGKETGLPLPWKITVDKDSRQVLAVRRNWDEADELCLPKVSYVKYSYVRAFGFYDIGLLQILGDTTLAATAGWREMLDAAAFSCFPGFLYLKSLGKQLTNEFRIPPGGGMPIDVAGIANIRDAIMPLPYQPPNQAMMALIQDVVQTGQRVGGTAELPTGEGRQDAPVGTVLALIEQATKIEGAVFKNLHQAQGEEFRLLKELFMEDPESLWRHNKKSKVLQFLLSEAKDTDPSVALDVEKEEQLSEAHKRRFVAALADCDLVPMADPNTSSKMMRHMKTAAMLQVVMGDPAFNQTEVKLRALRDMGVDDPDSLLAPPSPTGAMPDPAMIKAQADVMKAQASLIDMQNKQRAGITDAQLQQAKLASQERIASMGVVKEQIIHQNDARKAQREFDAQTQGQHTDRLVDMHKQHLDRQADLQKHAMTVAAQQAGGRVDDHHRHLDREAERDGGRIDDLHRHLDRAADLHKHKLDLEAQAEDRKVQEKAAQAKTKEKAE